MAPAQLLHQSEMAAQQPRPPLPLRLDTSHSRSLSSPSDSIQSYNTPQLSSNQPRIPTHPWIPRSPPPRAATRPPSILTPSPYRFYHNPPILRSSQQQHQTGMSQTSRHCDLFLYLIVLFDERDGVEVSGDCPRWRPRHSTSSRPIALLALLRGWHDDSSSNQSLRLPLSLHSRSLYARFPSSPLAFLDPDGCASLPLP